MNDQRIAKTTRSDIRLGLLFAAMAGALSLELVTGRLTYGRASTVTGLVIFTLGALLRVARGVRGRRILRTGSEAQKRQWTAILGPEEKPRKSTKWSRRITIGIGVIAVIVGSWLLFYIFPFGAR